MLLVVDTPGEIQNANADWAYCNARKPLSELEPVAQACLTSNDPTLFLSLGSGPMVSNVVLPEQACRLFGPQIPQPKPGEPFGRPTDPDSTGGYYQPIRIRVADLSAIAMERISCGITGASPEDTQDFNARYKPNTNPEIANVDVPPSIARGSVAHLTVSWVACPDGDPASCTGAERYLQYDVVQQHNVVRRETMRVSWFVTAGSVSADTSGRTEDDMGLDASTDFTAPSDPMLVHVWAVLRDGRGGIAWRAFDLNVQ
jgi:hypothetical protein